MLKISLFELVTRGILESVLFVLANYAFAKKRVVTIPFMLSSFILIAFTYGVRLLDINFGVHTILNLICLIFLSVYINKIDLYVALKGSMFATLTMFVIEAFNVIVLQLIFKDNLKSIIDNPYHKALAGIPGIFIFGVVVFCGYFYCTQKTKIRGENGTVSE